MTEEDAAIHVFIDTVMADTQVNCSWIPDTLERNMYYRILKFTMNALKRVISSVSFRFLNHEIVFDIRPISYCE